MTEDMDIKESLKYLDDILSYLINHSHGYRLTFKELYKYKIGRDLDTDNELHAKGYFKSLYENDKLEFFNLSDNTYAQAEKLVEAMYFLHTNDYIRLSEDFSSKVTYKGIMQYSKGFLNQHEKEVNDSKYLRSVQKTQKMYQKYTLIISILAFILSIGSLFFKLDHREDKPNDSNQQENTK